MQSAERLELKLRTSVEQKELEKQIGFLTQRFGPDGTSVKLNMIFSEFTTEDEIRQALQDAGYKDQKLEDQMRKARSLLAQIKIAKERRDALQ